MKGGVPDQLKCFLLVAAAASLLSSKDFSG